MRIGLVVACAALATASPALTQTPLERGFSAALHGCDEWVLHPASWANDLSKFAAAVGLADSMMLVDHVEPATLPPPALRVANHYWRINSTQGAGYILVVSDTLPMCHITGGGDVDLQPAVEAVLGSSEFSRRWDHVEDAQRGDMISTVYRSRDEPAFSITVSRAKAAGGRLDHVQVIATALFRTK